MKGLGYTLYHWLRYSQILSSEVVKFVTQQQLKMNTVQLPVEEPDRRENELQNQARWLIRALMNYWLNY